MLSPERLPSVAAAGGAVLWLEPLLALSLIGVWAATVAVTKRASIASILLGNAVYALCLWLGGGLDAALKPTWAGLLPVFWALLASIVGAVLVSLATSPQPRAQLERAFSQSSS